MINLLAHLRTMRKPFEALDAHWARLQRMAKSHTHQPTRVRAQAMLYESRTRDKRIEQFVEDFFDKAKRKSAERKTETLKHNTDPASIENFRRIEDGAAMSVEDAHRRFVSGHVLPKPAPAEPQAEKESYCDRVRRMSLEELSAGPTRAVREAVAQAHAAGRSTVGRNKAGIIVRTYPDGHEEPLEPSQRDDGSDLLTEVATAVAVDALVEATFDDTPAIDDTPTIGTDTDTFTGGGGDFGGAGSSLDF